MRGLVFSRFDPRPQVSFVPQPPWDQGPQVVYEADFWGVLVFGPLNPRSVLSVVLKLEQHSPSKTCRPSMRWSFPKPETGCKPLKPKPNKPTIIRNPNA